MQSTKAAAADFHIDGWLVQPMLNRLSKDGATCAVRPQLMDLLVCLASRPGVVFGRDELVAQVWDGRYVGSTAVTRCISELRTTLGDDPQQPHIIETISKRGYRLIVPVRPAGPAAPSERWAVSAATERDEVAEPDQAPPPRPWEWMTRVARRLNMW